MPGRRTLVVAFALAGTAAADTPDQPRFAPAGELQAKVTKTADGLATTSVPTGPGGIVVFAHRTRTGEAEIHMNLNDEIIVESGRGTMLVGGRVDNGREVSSGEWRGGTLTGGRGYALAAGDTLWIPAGTPHRLVLTDGGDIRYFAVKFRAEMPVQP